MNLDDMLNEMMLDDILMDLVKDDTVQQDFVDELNDFMAQEEQDDIVEILEAEAREKAFKREKEILIIDRLVNETTRDLYGNDTVKNEKHLVRILESIETGEDENIIEMVQDAYTTDNMKCTRTQAISKLAIALNLYPEGTNWFQNQIEIIKHNNALLKNPEVIKDVYPRVYSKIKEGSPSRKYYVKLMYEFQEMLERSGIFYSSARDTAVICSVSIRYVKGENSSNKTASSNMNDLHVYGFTRKLTDDEVMDLSITKYDEIVRFKKMLRVGNTINNYLLIKWTPEVLEKAEERISYCRIKKLTHASQNYHTMRVAGFGDTITKISDKSKKKFLSDRDLENIKTLYNWAREKYKSKGCGFISKKDWEEQFNNPERPHPIYCGERKRQMYRVIIMHKLDLVPVYTTKALKKALQKGKNKNTKVWRGVAAQSHTLIKRNFYESHKDVLSLI